MRSSTAATTATASAADRAQRRVRRGARAPAGRAASSRAAARGRRGGRRLADGVMRHARARGAAHPRVGEVDARHPRRPTPAPRPRAGSAAGRAAPARARSSSAKARALGYRSPGARLMRDGEHLLQRIGHVGPRDAGVCRAQDAAAQVVAGVLAAIHAARTGCGRRAASTPSRRAPTPRSRSCPSSAPTTTSGALHGTDIANTSSSEARARATTRCRSRRAPARRSSSRRMLLGLTSRCTRPARCADSSALAIFTPIASTSSTGRRSMR